MHENDTPLSNMSVDQLIEELTQVRDYEQRIIAQVVNYAAQESISARHRPTYEKI